MREIKFRAWDKKRKKMITDFILSSDGTVLCVGASNLKYEGTHNTKLVLMQFTGLKDCKGNDIYEGDILKYVGSKCLECGAEHTYPDHKLYQIKWVQKNVCFECISVDNFMDSNIWHTDMEVIGNIWQNKELLEDNDG